MSRPPMSARRSPRESRRKKAPEEESESKEDDNESASPVVSASSWNNVDRGRSRVRRLSNSFSEESLRRRCVSLGLHVRMMHSSVVIDRGYHTIVSSFNKVFHLERRW